MMSTLSFANIYQTDRDVSKLHPKLQRVIEAVQTRGKVQFFVTEAMRTSERQLYLYEQGLSRIKENGMHQQGFAFDIAVYNAKGKVSWEWRDFTPVINEFKHVSELLGIKLVYGYDWGWDAPHIELDKREVK